MEREILFKTVHGSRLYGLAHANSDNDFYTVVAKQPVPSGRQVKARYAKQTIIDNEDSMVVDFGTWVEQCKAGVPQALEAMFSNMPVGEDSIADFRASFRAGTGVYERYLRTIKSFALAEDNTFKKKRHALRLALNLRQIGHTGRFDPTLSPIAVEFVNRWATREPRAVYVIARHIAWK